jgi:dipeptidyl aminopeptidase/acylaminoacyl peptidase
MGGISAGPVAFSRDGRWVAYVSYPGNTLWRSRVDGSEQLQLTYAPEIVAVPTWSPDGKRIACSGFERGKPWTVYVVSADGGAPERVLPEDRSQGPADWSPDGNSLVLSNIAVREKIINLRPIDLVTRKVSDIPRSDGLFLPSAHPTAATSLRYPPTSSTRRSLTRLRKLGLSSSTVGQRI